MVEVEGSLRLERRDRWKNRRQQGLPRGDVPGARKQIWRKGRPAGKQNVGGREEMGVRGRARDTEHQARRTRYLKLM